jgi:hypothetical protein
MYLASLSTEPPTLYMYLSNIVCASFLHVREYTVVYVSGSKSSIIRLSAGGRDPLKELGLISAIGEGRRKSDA